jgi:hypothetical protein
MFRNRLFPIPAWLVELGDLGDWPLYLLAAGHGNIGFLPEPMSVYRVHSSGVWTRRPLAQRLIPVSEMMSHVDHYYQGRYRSPIEKHRTRLLSWLCSEVDHLRSDLDQAGKVLAPRNRELEQVNEELQQRVELLERARITSRLQRTWAKFLRHLPGAAGRAAAPTSEHSSSPSTRRAA